MIDNEEYKKEPKKILQDVFQLEIKMESLDKVDIKINKTMNWMK